MAIFATALLLGLVSWAHAADDVVAPPANVDNSPAARETVQVQEDSPDLKKELGSLKDNERIEVRSYKRKDGATIQEYSVHGHVYMVKVQPKGGLPAYYLYDENGDGVFEKRLPGGYKRPSPPMWVIKRF
ncbi:MAG: DUF2782 domain-containing protein [Zetaproteobacteria bacterium]|nr:MAG: DUF2782 domain-containing protein [Zetaproteobacteria bacterium]